MAAPVSPSSPRSVETRLRLAPGFAGRLGVGLGLALIGSYLLLAGLTVVRRGGPLPYVVASDLISNLSGAAILEQGQPLLLYDRAAQGAAQAAILREGGLGLLRPLPFIHLPFEALLIAPLHAWGLSYVAIFALWTGLGLACVGASLYLLVRTWPLPGRGRVLAGLAALTFYPVYVTLLVGQSTAFLLLAWAASTVALRRGHDGWAGAVLALAAIKPQALPVVLFVLLLMRRWRALGTFGAVVGGAVGLTLPFLGWDWPVRYLRLAFSVGGYPADPVLDTSVMSNWRGLLVRLLGDTPTAYTLSLVITALALLAVAALWLVPRGGRWQPGTAAWDRRWATTLFVNLLATPYLLTHDLALAVVPGWMLAWEAYARRDWRLGSWLWLGWGLGFLAATRSLPLPPVPLWLTLTAAWVFWAVFRSPAPVLEPASGG